MGRPKKNPDKIEYPKSYEYIMKKAQGWYYQKGDPSTRVYYKTPNEAGIAIYGKQVKKKKKIVKKIKKTVVKNEETKG